MTPLFLWLPFAARPTADSFEAMRINVVATVALLLAGCAGEPASDAEPAETDTPEVRAPVTTATTPTTSGELLAPDVPFDVLGGGQARLSDFRDRILVVNFWGTWCAPCRREIPELVRLYDDYENHGVEVIGIAVDSGSEETIRTFADQFEVDYPIWITGGAVATGEFGAIGYPFTLIIDGDGVIRNQLLGPQDYETLEAEIERARAGAG